MKKQVLLFVGMLALTPAAALANTGDGYLTEIAAPYDNITVKGTVVDETGSPIPGCSWSGARSTICPAPARWRILAAT